MSKTIVNLILLFIVLIPAQAIFFNNMVLFNVAVPLVFIYLIISMPLSFNTNISTTIGFLTGLAVDILSDTPGHNALACTVLAFVRRPVFRLYTSFEDDLGSIRPTIRVMGQAGYMKYLLTMIMIYTVIVFLVETFQIFNLKVFFLRVICSTLLTFVIIYAISCLSLSRREKKP